MKERIVVIEGDGIGPEVVDSAVSLLKYLDPNLKFDYYKAGDEAALEGPALPPETMKAAEESSAVLLGACGETAADVIIKLRQKLDTYVNLRPVKSLPGVNSLYDDVDIVIVRENTEGLYRDLEQEICAGVTTATRVITEKASKRIGEYAFDYARENGYGKVSIVHKSNVMQKTGGLFSRTIKDVSKDYQDIETEEVLVDAASLYLVKDPDRFEVIVTTNLFGDILSDLSGGLVGGLGLCPSANIGRDNGIFEPVHGTAPDIAGRGIANPTAMILSASHMLKFLNKKDLADELDKAVTETLQQGETTPDLGGSLTTSQMTACIKEKLR